MPPSLLEISFLCAAALLAGLVDAIAGGGGLIQLPALLLIMPATPISALIGTNKLASIAGTSVATSKYLGHIKLDRRWLLPAALTAFVASGAGAYAVTYFEPQKLKPVVAVLLVGVLVFTVARRDFGAVRRDPSTVARPVLKALAIVTVVGFYDGFLGPGTGGFLVFGFVGWLGLSFLEGGAAAKVINLATNAAALAYFSYKGLVIYEIAVPMAACNVLGGYLGSHLAIKKGSGFVRKVFIVVVGLVLLRLAYDIV